MPFNELYLNDAKSSSRFFYLIQQNLPQSKPTFDVLPLNHSLLQLNPTHNSLINPTLLTPIIPSPPIINLINLLSSLQSNLFLLILLPLLDSWISHILTPLGRQSLILLNL